MQQPFDSHSTMVSLLALIARFPLLKIAVIGDCMLDIYLEGDAERLCSEAPVPVIRSTQQTYLLGGAANTAANITALGGSTLLLGYVGQDYAGSLFQQALQQAGLAATTILIDPARTTLVKLRLVANQHLLARFDSRNISSPSRSLQQQLLEVLDACYASLDALIISDYRYGVLSEELIEHIAHLHADHPCPIIVDSKQLTRFAAFPATVLTPNEVEAQQVMQIHLGKSANEANIKDRARTLAYHVLAHCAAEAVCLTLGKYGVFLAHRCGEEHFLPAYPIQQACDVGAGDTLVAVMTLALAAGASFGDAARLGLAGAAIAVQAKHTKAVTQAELLQFLERHEQGLMRRTGA